jgi:hypothetical protein
LMVKDISEGMYVITVQSEDGYVIRQKVIVLHKQ